jgi:hypothetical protein
LFDNQSPENQAAVNLICRGFFIFNLASTSQYPASSQSKKLKELLSRPIRLCEGIAAEKL